MYRVRVVVALFVAPRAPPSRARRTDVARQRDPRPQISWANVTFESLSDHFILVVAYCVGACAVSIAGACAARFSRHFCAVQSDLNSERLLVEAENFLGDRQQSSG